jgi:hypothetical protein
MMYVANLFLALMACAVILAATPFLLAMDAVSLLASKLRVKWLWGQKDGGPDSRVYVWGLEIKGLFSVLVLRFDEGSREAFHTHAFNSISWLLSGRLHESTCPKWGGMYVHFPSWTPIRTTRLTFHKVDGVEPSNWVLTFRGPWADTWRDVSAAGDVTLTHGRKVVS